MNELCNREQRQKNQALVKAWQASSHGKRCIRRLSVKNYYSQKYNVPISREDASEIARYIKRTTAYRKKLKAGEISQAEYREKFLKYRHKKLLILYKCGCLSSPPRLPQESC